MFATAYKRRYLKGGSTWHYQYIVEPTAKRIIEQYGIDADSIETASVLARDPERRIAFQADIQDYVDMGISSTLNLPEWGSEWNNENKVEDIAHIVAKYCHRLRGLTMYPNGARGGQPLTAISYSEAIEHEGTIFTEDENKCSNGICGL